MAEKKQFGWGDFYRTDIRESFNKIPNNIKNARSLGFFGSIFSFGALIGKQFFQKPSEGSKFFFGWTNAGQKFDDIVIGKSARHSLTRLQEQRQASNLPPLTWLQRTSFLTKRYFSDFKNVGNLLTATDGTKTPSFFSSISPIKLLNPFRYVYGALQGAMSMGMGLIDWAFNSPRKGDSPLPARIFKAIIVVPLTAGITALHPFAHPGRTPFFKSFERVDEIPKRPISELRSEKDKAAVSQPTRTSEYQPLPENRQTTVSERLNSQARLASTLNRVPSKKFIDPNQPMPSVKVQEKITIPNKQTPLVSKVQTGIISSIRNSLASDSGLYKKLMTAPSVNNSVRLTK